MGHLPDLIKDLALILMAGAVTTLLFRKLKQPVVLGYIIAGFLVGPHFALFPTVADEDNIEVLAEIGVIFLLFSLGLEFSFKKLLRVGGAASVTALVEIAFITVAGYFAGVLMGWSTMDCLFLGGMLASSSTTIIIRAFDELGVKTKKFAGVVFGVLVVEDIVVILLMVLLSTVAATQQIAGAEIVFTIAKLLFFLVLWFVAGIFLIPSLLKLLRPLLDEEMLLILALGLCLGMVVVATKAGFSAELGAFIMGSIIAETTSAEKVEHLIKPVKDLFGAVFFVSVGMLIHPGAIVENAWPVVIVTVLTMVGKMISTTAGALISGQPLKQSIQVGMSMAQIGEFAFIVATLGLSLGVISDFLFPVAVGASAITTFTTPYFIKFSNPVYQFVERQLPEKWVRGLQNYASSAQSIQAESDWQVVLRSYTMIILTNGMVLLTLIFVSVSFLMPWLRHSGWDPTLTAVVGLVVSLLVSAPFLWALMAKRPNNMAYREMWMEKRYSRGPLLLLEVGRVVAGITIICFLVFKLFSTTIALLIAMPVIIAVFFVFAKRIQAFYQRIEVRFLGNLNARETAQYNTLDANVSRKTADIQSSLSPWDAHIVQLAVPPYAAYVGRTLRELEWREKFGINIVYIKRGEDLINTPQRNHILLPYDQVGILATDEQLQAFKPVFDEQAERSGPAVSVNDIVLRKIVVNEVTRLKGFDVRTSGIRERTSGLVIGIERNNNRILNPDSTVVFEWGDVVWIVGEKTKIDRLLDGSEVQP
ncbi:MAG TPA: cation:proton antiporter [Chryseolinea sp.]|nr:cation:proton antiporter [Chryseolinea sp.]